MLYLVSTPIGNLKDLTLRALEILNSCDLILCEDTRTSSVLLNKYDIKTPLKSFHKFNEHGREEEILELLNAGKNIALISDAGTPCISDPGEQLVALCIQKEIQLSAAPGPCALIEALSLSGLSTIPFQFLGFVPKKKQERSTVLRKALLYPGTSIFYESPHRIDSTLEILRDLAPHCKLVIARELSKFYEEILRGTPEELLLRCPLKGELVLLLPHTPLDEISKLSLEEEVQALQERGLSEKEALRQLAQEKNISRRELYNQLHSKP